MKKIKIRRHTRFLVGLAILYGLGGYEIWRHWGDKSAANVESISTLVVAALTIILAYYNWELATVTQDALALSRKEFESEWRPDLRIVTIAAQTAQLRINIANLSRCTALVKTIEIGTGGVRAQGIEPQQVRSYHLAFLVDAGTVAMQFAGAQMDDYRLHALKSPEQCSPSIRVVYDCAGQNDLRSEWFDFVLTYSLNAIQFASLR
jgi:hypothetical protein